MGCASRGVNWSSHRALRCPQEGCSSTLVLNAPQIGSALVAMYDKCSMLASSKQMLEELPIRNEVSWSSLISGYAQQCRGYEVLKCFGKDEI